MQCIRARWYEHRNVNVSERLKQINELSARLKKYMLSHVAKSYKIYKAGEMLEGYKAIDGIVKHEGRNMLLAVYPETSPDLGEISHYLALIAGLIAASFLIHPQILVKYQE